MAMAIELSDELMPPTKSMTKVYAASMITGLYGKDHEVLSRGAFIASFEVSLTCLKEADARRAQSRGRQKSRTRDTIRNCSDTEMSASPRLRRASEDAKATRSMRG